MKDILLGIAVFLLAAAIVLGIILLVVAIRVGFFALIGWLIGGLMPGTIYGALAGLGLTIEPYQLGGLLGLVSFIWWRPNISVTAKK